jgi:hypothetical protein
MIGNTVLLFKFLLKLWPFLKEIFFKNKDFQDAVRSNKSIVTLLCASLVLLLLTIGNAQNSQEYARLYDRLLRESRETTSKYQQLITDHAVLVGKFDESRDNGHQLEVDLATSKANLASLEQRVTDLQISLEYERTRNGKKK